MESKIEDTKERRRDLKGKTFGSWTAVDPVMTKSGAVHWSCICGDCGAIESFSPKQLRAHSTIVPVCEQCLKGDGDTFEKKVYQSFKKRLAKERKSSRRDQFESFDLMPSEYWSQTVHSAKRRDIEVTITKEEAIRILKDQKGLCALTGMKISLFPSDEDVGLASIDRIDSNGAYEVGNVQWLHKDVNKMKMDFDEEHFVSVCMAVANNFMTARQGRRIEPHDEQEPARELPPSNGDWFHKNAVHTPRRVRR
jgi:hypothetical protein